MDEVTIALLGVFAGALLSVVFQVLAGVLGRDFDQRAACRVLAFSLRNRSVEAAAKDWAEYRLQVSHGLNLDQYNCIAAGFEGSDQQKRDDALEMLEHYGEMRQLSLARLRVWSWDRRHRRTGRGDS